MSDCKSERVNIKFLVKLKKSTTKTFQLLTEAYGEDIVHACANGTNDFRKAESLKDDDSPGRPHTAVTDDNIEKVWDVIWKDRSLGVWAAVEEVNLDRESVHRILWDKLNIRKVCVKMVPKVLSDEQKECCKELCLDLFATHWEWTRFVDFDNYLWWNLDIYVWYGNQATINAVEVNIISKTKKKHAWVIRSSRPCWLFSLISRVLWWQSGTQWPEGKSAVLHWSLDEIAWMYEKEMTRIMEKQVDFAPGQCASPQCIVCEAIFS